MKHGKQISFQYYDYSRQKEKVLKNDGEVYKLSPYKLLWSGDYYYVIGYSENFFMYAGDEVEIELRCDNSLMKTMVDRSGEAVATFDYDSKW